MRTLRALQPPTRISPNRDRAEQTVLDAIRVLSETIFHLNERVEVLEAREQLRVR